MSITQQVALARAEAKRKENSVRFLRTLDRVLKRIEKIKFLILMNAIGWGAIFFMVVGIMTVVGIISEVLKK